MKSEKRGMLTRLKAILLASFGLCWRHHKINIGLCDTHTGLPWGAHVTILDPYVDGSSAIQILGLLFELVFLTLLSCFRLRQENIC